MDLASINWVAVLVASVAAMVVGAIWYSPAVFGNAWLKAIGKKKEDLSGANVAYAITFVGSVVSAVVMAYVMSLAGVVEPMPAAVLAGWMWLGFVVPPMLAEHVFGTHSRELFQINAGQFLAALVTTGVVLSFFV